MVVICLYVASNLAPWLKLIAEYSKSENEYSANVNDPTTFNGSTESDTFSLGTFFVW